jgi:hypothetical protein
MSWRTLVRSFEEIDVSSDEDMDNFVVKPVYVQLIWYVYEVRNSVLKLYRLRLNLNEQLRTVVLDLLCIRTRCDLLRPLRETLEGFGIGCNRMSNKLETLLAC